jgi:acyl-CoA thioester hydrolase
MRSYKYIQEIRVRYSETDQMGYVYYGVYASYFEVTRVEAMRNLGVSYKELELSGIMMPVSEYSIKYKRPCKYDELLRIEVVIKEMPAARIRFYYSTFNEQNELANEAYTELFFMDAHKQRPVRAPEMLTNALDNYFHE